MMKPHEAYHTDFWIDGGDLEVYAHAKRYFKNQTSIFI